MPHDLSIAVLDTAPNTFAVRDDSFAAVEIGDSKQEDFYPQAKISRWDNEVNFSVRLVTDSPAVVVGTPDEVATVQAATATRISDSKIKGGGTILGGGTLEPAEEPVELPLPVVALVDDAVVWATPAQEVHFYEFDDDDGGGLEVEVVLNEPPPTNVISFTIETKGLDFFYQPELTQEDIDLGSIRPDKVVGSYAVYHSTAKGDYTMMGGKNYMAGKAFHIYRPWIVDSDGNGIWGDLNIDLDAGLLTVTIDQNFLDKATYPVRHAAGLKFGYNYNALTSDTGGGTNNGLCKAYGGGGDPSLPEQSGTLYSILVLVYCGLVTNNFNPALYTDSSGVPANRQIYINSGGTLMTGGTKYFVETLASAMTGDPSIVANTQYWLGIGDPAGSNTFQTFYDTAGVGNELYYSARKNWPTTASGWTKLSGRRYGAYAKYTPSNSLIPAISNYYRMMRGS